MPDVDAALYVNEFPSSEIEGQCRQFHQAPLSRKIELVSEFGDLAIRELAMRLLCRNYGLAYRFPEYAAYEQRVLKDDDPLLDYRARPRLTPEAALAGVGECRQGELTPREQRILDDLERYVGYQVGSAIS